MLTGAPPSDRSDRASLTPAPRRRVWPWAAGSILITLAVIAATLVGHRLAAQERLALQVAPASAAPPLAVEGIIHAPSQVAQLTLDAHAHTLVAQVQSIGCAPPTPLSIHCGPAVPPVSGVVFYDSATGAVRAEHVTSSTGADDSYTLTDTTRGVTYLVTPGSDLNGVATPGSVTTFADTTGQQIGAYAIQIAWGVQSVALNDHLGLIYALDNTGALSAYNAADGQLMASAPTTAAPAVGLSQLITDPGESRVYIVTASGADQPELLHAYAATDLSPLGSWRLPQGLQPGPFDPISHTLYLLTGDQNDWSLDLAALPANGAGQAVSPQMVPQFLGENRFGVDHATGEMLLMTNASVEAFATGAMQPDAQLPLVSGSPETSAVFYPWLLPIDASAELAYLPGADNTILLVSLARPVSDAAPNAATAALIARAGMAKLLPDTNQNPAFVTAQTFPLSVSKVTRNYFIHYSDLGWKGPYTGTASISGVTAGATPGDYTMTFTITWNQLFLRQHSWTVEVTPDGRTHLLADSGDAIP